MTNDQSMVERVAIALHENSDSPNSWGDASDSRKDYCRDQARAAITAMRSAPIVLYEAGDALTASAFAKGEEADAEQIWVAIISAALQDPGR